MTLEAGRVVPLKTPQYSHRSPALSVGSAIFRSRAFEYRRTMAKTLVSRTQANPRALVSRIVEDPALVSAVQALPPAALLRLIDHVGLEDAGELVALATADQLCRVFDEDVWQSARPGEDERFDPQRFTLWLEVMLEVGERFAASKLAELPEELVELALHHHVMVISLQELALLISEGEGQVPLEKVVEDSPYLELGDYCVIARRPDGWDAIVTVLLALDERHSNVLQPMLERLWRVTSEWIYGQGGLYEVLTSAEMLEADPAADREDRRARAGFVAASSARSFLALARKDDIGALLRAPSRDPITRVFFREYQPVPRDLGGAAREPESAGLRELLEAAGDTPAAGLLEAVPATRPMAQTLLARALVEVGGRDRDRHGERMGELGYLANVLLAGAGTRGGRLRPLDAAEAALAICSLGLDHAVLLDQDGGRKGEAEERAAHLLERLSCDVLFRVGWRLLREEVTLPALAAVERVAAMVDTADPQDRAAGERLAAAARTAVKEGRPAAAAARLDVLAGTMDEAQLELLAALTDDIPGLRSAEGGREWIASVAHLRRARSFLEGL
jgi:hypothetical protein